jgi:hypothetical protein
MAKTKKKEKVIDFTRPEKITDEQLKHMQEMLSIVNKAHFEIGTMESRKHELMHGIEDTKKGLADLQQEFQKAYGTFDVNVVNGTINYPAENGELNKED